MAVQIPYMEGRYKCCKRKQNLTIAGPDIPGKPPEVGPEFHRTGLKGS